MVLPVYDSDNMIKTNRIPFGEYGFLVYIVFFEGLMPEFQSEDSPSDRLRGAGVQWIVFEEE